MKRIIFLLAAIPMMIVGNSCNNNSKSDGKDSTDAKKTVSLQVKGSDTMLPLIQAEAEAGKDKGFDVSVTGGGSGVGIEALMNSTTDLCMASRDLEDKENIKIEEKKLDVTKAIVAYDALSVIVNPKNKVSQLTKEQLKDIFTGKVTNWNQVGGTDMKIVVVSRDNSSGTFKYFSEKVNDKVDYTKDALMKPSNDAICETVNQSEGAIGYVGLAYVTPDKNIKSVAVSWDKGKTYVSPSVKTAMDKTYPISRPLFLMYEKKNADKAKGFVDFAMSDAGQDIVKKQGYVPLH